MILSDVLAGGMVYLGFLLFLVAFHLITINTSGNMNTVLNGVFIALVSIFVGMLIFGITLVIIQMFRYLTYQITTPNWKKRKGEY